MTSSASLRITSLRTSQRQVVLTTANGYEVNDTTLSSVIEQGLAEFVPTLLASYRGPVHLHGFAAPAEVSIGSRPSVPVAKREGMIQLQQTFFPGPRGQPWPGYTVQASTSLALPRGGGTVTQTATLELQFVPTTYIEKNPADKEIAAGIKATRDSLDRATLEGGYISQLAAFLTGAANAIGLREDQRPDSGISAPSEPFPSGIAGRNWRGA